MSRPPAIRQCTNPRHPARRHGHYGYGGRYWCSDFSSPLLSAENGGVIEGRWIVIFEKIEPGDPETGVDHV